MSRKMVLVGAFHEIVELCEACDVKIAGIFDEHVQGAVHGPARSWGGTRTRAAWRTCSATCPC